MKKSIFWTVTACIMIACGSKTGKAVSDTDSLAVDSINGSVVDKHSEAYIRQRIDTIYKFVGKITYDAEGNRDYNYSPFNLDSAYCSERYYALMQQASAICDETGDILYDYDYWVRGQDISDDWSYKVAKVYHVTDSTALVDMIIHNFSDSENTIALRFERDDWYIDDFNPSDDGNDDKASLRRVIKQGKCSISHRLASKGYDGPIRLRKGYFYYREDPLMILK